jgi:hypothetical protein
MMLRPATLPRVKEIFSNGKRYIAEGIVTMGKALWKGSKSLSNLLHLPMIILASLIFWLLLANTSSSEKKVDLKETLTVDREESKGLINDGDKLIIDRFSTATEERDKGFVVPKGWHLLRFRGTKTLTQYSPVEDGNNVYLRAESNGSAAVIYKIAQFDPREYPFIAWEWKTENIIEKGNAYTKKGNDFSVSLGIIFDYDPQRASVLKKIKYSFIKLFYGLYPPDYVILYVWGNGVHEKKGDIISSPYSDTVKLFVLENGSSHLYKWRTEERNILEDFKEAFGTYPQQRVGGIGIHTDSDNTSYYYKNRYQAVGYYDDIIVSKIPCSVE